MGILGSLLLKDLRRRLAEPAGVLASLAIPLVIAGTMALTFGSRVTGGAEQPKVRAVVVDEDGTPLSNILSGSSNNKEASEHMEIKMAADRAEGMQVMREEDYSAMLIIPKGFSDAFLEGRHAELQLVKNPSQQIMPIVIEQGAQAGALYLSVGSRFLGPGEMATLRKLLDGKGWDDGVKIASLITDAYTRIQKADDLLFPPIIKVDEAGEEKEEGKGGFDFISWMFPGMIVMGLLFVSQNQMKDMLREQTAGTLRRQLSAPVTPALLLVSKMLASGVVVGAGLALMLATGSLFFGIHWGSPGPLAASFVLLVLGVTGFSSIVYAVARTERQGDAFGGILIMLMSLLGGAFVPVQLLPGYLHGLAKATVNHWGNETFRALAGGGGWGDVAPTLPGLAAMGLALTAIGVYAMSRRVSRGAV